MLLRIPRSARCVQRFDDSLNSAIHITYRISLRSSSMREPRDPLLKVVCIFITSNSTFQNNIQEIVKETWTWRAVLYQKKPKNSRPTVGAQRRNEIKMTGVHMPQEASNNPLKFYSIMILPQVHLRKPCYDFYFL